MVNVEYFMGIFLMKQNMNIMMMSNKAKLLNLNILEDFKDIFFFFFY